MLETVVLPVLLAQDPGSPAAFSRVRETAYARIETALTIAADPKLVQAVTAKNQTPETPAHIQRTDEQWKRNPEFALRKELTGNACATRLRSLLQADAIVVEALLMDMRGGLVCSTVETSDYWQGDEPKWTKTYAEGARVFVDEPALDASTDIVAIQLSVPVRDNGNRIGALTLTLKVPPESSVARK